MFVAPTPVSATPALATVPLSKPELHADGDGREVADAALELEIGAFRSAALIGHSDLGHDLGGVERGRERALEEAAQRQRPLALRSARDDLRTGRQQRGAPVALRVRVRDRAADRAEVADDRIEICAAAGL